MVKEYSMKRDGDVQLSTHFKLHEFRCKNGADTVLVDTDLVALLEKIRMHYMKPVVINSAYRTKEYNASIKNASPKSQHVLGKAADIRVKNIPPKEVARYVNMIMPNKGGIGIYGTFTHVDVRANKSRWNG